MKNLTKIAQQILSLIVVVSFLAACSSGKKSSADEVAFEDANKKIVADMDQVIKDLPPPTEVPYMLQATAADYNPGIINGFDNLDGYLAVEDKAALNLGIYATDMGYVLAYEQNKASMDYLEVCQKLAEAVGVASVFDLATIERFQANIGNNDSLNALLSESIVEIESRLERADRVNVAALVLTGSFIEGLHLATLVVETYPTDILDETNRNLILEPMIKVVLDQEKPLIDLIKLLGDLPQDDIIRKMINELNILKLHYDGDLADIQEKIKNNTGDFVLTQDMLIDVTTEVKRIRKDIISL